MEKLDHHIPVLADATVEPLLGAPGKVFLDLTLGGGGHASQFLTKRPDATLWGFDRDQAALDRVTKRFPDLVASGRLRLVHRSFGELPDFLRENGISTVSGIMADLGFSSFQIDSAERGFSFRQDGPLDMRMDQGSGVTAAEIVNTWSREDLQKLFSEYGEERYSGRISYAIEKARNQSPIKRTTELADLVEAAVPKVKGPGKRIHPATRVFQALRIEVNNELGQLRSLLDLIPGVLEVGGRASIITFHSLEDRMVKQHFRGLSADCICPPQVMSCERCHKPPGKLFYRKAVAPTDEEMGENPRARSAKVRAIERLR